MKPNRRIKEYAKTLLAVSGELNCIPETGHSLRTVKMLVKQESAFRAFFYTQKINPLEKINILRSVVGDLINPVIYEFFTLLAERNEYRMLMPIAAIYTKLEKESLNQVNVTAYSIDKIDQETIYFIVNGIEASTGKTVELSTQTNRELLGGLKLRVGNTIFDGTIANQMAKMKKILLQKY